MNRREMLMHNAKIIRGNVRGKSKAERHDTLNSLRFGVLAPAFFALMKDGGISKQMQADELECRKGAFA